MPSSSVAAEMQEQPIDINQRKDELIAEITSRLLRGQYNYSFLWNSLIERHQTSQWKLPDSDKIREILQNTTLECEDRIKRNCPKAMMLRAQIHMNGLDCEKDYHRAIELLDQAIALDYVPAINDRAWMHQEGQGGKQDYERAIELYDQAIALGNAHAMHNRAWMHQQGLGGKQDYERAIELYDQAIALGSNAYAMNNRAWMHQEGLGGKQDYERAIELYDQAIALGNAHAMHNRAWIYHKGIGGGTNDARAIELYNQAISLGNVSSMFELAHMHRDALDHTKAARLFRLASKHGSTDSVIALRNLQNRNFFYKYHFFMTDLNFDMVIDLMITESKMLDEFLHHDLPMFSNNSKAQSPSVEGVISKLITRSKQDKSDNKLLIQILVAIDKEEKTQSTFSAHQAELKLTLLSEINFAETNKETFNSLAFIVIDTWTCLGEQFTQNAADYLSSMIGKKSPQDLIECLKDSTGHEIVKIGTLILLKAIHGEQYGLSLATTLYPGHLAMLVAQYTYQVTFDSFVGLNKKIFPNNPVTLSDDKSSPSPCIAACSSEGIERIGFFSDGGSEKSQDHSNNPTRTLDIHSASM